MLIDYCILRKDYLIKNSRQEGDITCEKNEVIATFAENIWKAAFMFYVLIIILQIGNNHSQKLALLEWLDIYLPYLPERDKHSWILETLLAV